MNELEKMRARIDEIDASMTALFEERMNCVREIAAYKKENGIAVTDPARENEVLNRNAARVSDERIRPFCKRYFRSLMEVSRAYQNSVNASDGTFFCGGEEITVQSGLLSHLRDYLPETDRTMILTDEKVPEEYVMAVALASKHPVTVKIPAGEPSKCLDSAKLIYRMLLQKGFTRSDRLIAVGGGVVGDLAGYVAATYQRGMEFYNVPTTLLAQVDSSVGDKTAIDFEGFKNQIGAFYPPKKVLIDPDVLKTLPKRQISAGLAEIVKAAVIGDADLFTMLENGGFETNPEEVIRRALAVKCAIVEDDEREHGRRMLLNYGHTLGHGIESVTGNLHGECVALGMLPFSSPAVRARLIPLLERFGLPISFDGLDIDAALAASEHDKKRRGDFIYYVFAEEIGKCELRLISDTLFDAMVRLELEKF